MNKEYKITIEPKPMTEKPDGDFRYIFVDARISYITPKTSFCAIASNAIGWIPARATVEEVDSRPKVIIIEDCFGYYRTVFQAANGDIGEVYDPTSKEIALADGGDTDNYDIITAIPTPDSVEWLQ